MIFKYNVKSMIKNSSTIKDKQVAFLKASHYTETKTCYLIKKEHNAVIYEHNLVCSVFGQAFRIFTGKKAFAKYAIINMQYTGASTISCFKITLMSHFQSSDCSCLKITF